MDWNSIVGGCVRKLLGEKFKLRMVSMFYVFFRNGSRK